MKIYPKHIASMQLFSHDDQIYKLKSLKVNEQGEIKSLVLKYLYDPMSRGEFSIEAVKFVHRPWEDMEREIFHDGRSFIPIEEINNGYSNRHMFDLASHMHPGLLVDMGIVNDGKGSRSQITHYNLLAEPPEILDDLHEWGFDIYGLHMEKLSIFTEKYDELRKWTSKKGTN